VKKLLIYGIVGLLFIAGCAGRGQGTHPVSFSGVSEIELVRELGAPDRSYAVGDHKFLTYTRNRVQVLKGMQSTQLLDAPPLMTGAPSRIVRKYCITTFEVAEGKVLDWKAQGNDCPVF
jgi:hypothetical protein